MFTNSQYMIIIVTVVLIIISVFKEVKEDKILILILICLFFFIGTSWAGKHKDSTNSDIFHEITSTERSNISDGNSRSR